jgi:hypothetical protein
MKQRLRRYILGLGVVATLVLGSAGTAMAGNALCPANAPAAVKNSEVCKDQGDPVAGPGGLISDVTTLISVVAGIVAVVMIMYGGYLYITSSGDSNKIGEAKKTIMWSFVGLVVIVVARSIIVFVVNRL